MEELISKELLSEVLDKEIDSIKIKDNEIVYAFRVSSYGMTLHGYTHDEGSINIYELAHECKEWAFNNGYYLTSYNDAIDIILQRNCKVIENITDGSFKYNPTLVFKACEWIRKELLKLNKN